MMDELIEALQIFAKYDSQQWPTHCEHDILYIVGDYHPDKMNVEDVQRLEEIGFDWDEDDEGFFSFKYGSA